jgi:hypothetical protein
MSAMRTPLASRPDDASPGTGTARTICDAGILPTSLNFEDSGGNIFPWNQKFSTLTKDFV